jgi:hypothetical protein
MIGLKTAGSTAVSRETVTLAHFLDVADALVSWFLRRVTLSAYLMSGHAL